MRNETWEIHPGALPCQWTILTSDGRSVCSGWDGAEGSAYAILIKQAPALLEVCRLAVESQGWDGGDPNEDRWLDFYRRARATLSASMPTKKANAGT